MADSDWKEPEPGYLEIDLVAHCGGTVTRVVHQQPGGHRCVLRVDGGDPATGS